MSKCINYQVLKLFNINLSNLKINKCQKYQMLSNVKMVKVTNQITLLPREMKHFNGQNIINKFLAVPCLI